MERKLTFFICVFVTFFNFALAACSSSVPTSAPIVITATREVVYVVVTNTPTQPSPTQTEISSPTPLSAIITPFVSPFPTATVISITPQGQTTPLTYQNTPVPPANEPITSDNSNKLTLVAQWGRGNIVRVAYAPDGRFFFVGSQYGVAVYDSRNLNQPLKWIPFISVENIALTADSQYLQLQSQEHTVIYDLINEITVEAAQIDTTGETIPTPVASDQDSLRMVSPDGKIEFLGYRTCVRMEKHNLCSREETTYEKVTDLTTEKTLYERHDPVKHISYSEHTDAEGCDLAYFDEGSDGVDESILTPIPNIPYRAAFSPDGKTYAVLYRPADIRDSDRFSVLRVYRTSDGKLLNAIGTYRHPIEDFAYAPDSNTLIVGLVDGAIQIWDLPHNSVIYTARHFNAPIQYIEYTSDSQYLVIKQRNAVEIYAAWGGLRARFEAAAFALSPNAELLALADRQGNIRVIDLSTWKNLYQIDAHVNTIFALAFSADGKMLASSGLDCTIKVWNMETGKFLHENEQTIIEIYSQSSFASSRVYVYHMESIPGTSQLIGFGSWGTLVSWNIHSGATEYIQVPISLGYANDTVRMNPHFPDFLGVDAENGLFYVMGLGYHLNDGTMYGVYRESAYLPVGCEPSALTTADETIRIALGHNHFRGQICVIDNDTLQLVQLITVFPKSDTQSNPRLDWLQLSPDGNQLIAYSWSGMIYVFEINE